MASVHCRSCKAKITGGDVTCPSCGAPTSRVIPIVIGVAVVLTSLLLFNAYRQSSDRVTVKIPDSGSLFSTKNTDETTSVGMTEE